MKTFYNLIKEVQEPGRCHQCGGCVTFCTAINYGALELDENGKPRYKDEEKCIECGLCHMICPVINDLDQEIKNLVGWSAPMGRILKWTKARSKDREVLERATDGGIVTSLLIHLLDKGRIDGAVVSKKAGVFSRQPWLARSREELIDAAGFHFDTSQGMALFSEVYSTFSPSMVELEQIAMQHLKKVAFVGTPCQINALRRMEVLGIIPSDSIKYYFGLFCNGNFSFGEEQRRRLEHLGHFKWEDVAKVNVKDDLMVHLSNQEIRHIPLDQLKFMKRHACLYCDDYSAEYADISFGGIGAGEGWTTILIRNPLGRAVFADARGAVIEEYDPRQQPLFADQALAKVLDWSLRKKRQAAEQCQSISQPTD
jgi:coenzyme F420 hydrogenase subunit beta